MPEQRNDLTSPIICRYEHILESFSGMATQVLSSNIGEDKSRLVFKNLPKYLNDESLRSFLQGKGYSSLTDCRVLKAPCGKSRRFAFVGFSNAHDAEKALKYFHSTYIDTVKLQVEYALPPGCEKLVRPWSKYSKGSSRNEFLATKSEANKSSERNLPNLAQSNNRKKKSPSTAAHSFLSPFPHSSGSQAVDVKSTKAGMGNVRIHTTFSDEEVPNTNVQTSADMAVSSKSSVVESMPTSSTLDSESDMQWLIEKSRAETEVVQVPFVEMDNFQTPLSDDKTVSKNNINSSNNSTKQADAPKPLADKYPEEIPNLADDGRLMLLNLPYTSREEELRKFCQCFGEIASIQIPINEDTHVGRGFAFISFVFPEHAVKAYAALDGAIFQGRLLHAKVASVKPPVKNSDDLKGKPSRTSSFKRKQEEEKKLHAEDRHTWNLLFFSVNAATDAIADQLGVEKSEILDMNSNKLAVRVALGETHLIQQTKRWLAQEGIRMDAFERYGADPILATYKETGMVTSSATEAVKDIRSDDTFLVKHLPSDVAEEELRDMFGSVGILTRFCLAPTKLVAVVQYAEVFSAQRSFRRFAYKRFHNIPLYLEWAPLNIFENRAKTADPVNLAKGQGDDSVNAVVPSQHHAQLFSSTTLSFTPTVDKWDEDTETVTGMTSEAIKINDGLHKVSETLKKGKFLTSAAPNGQMHENLSEHFAEKDEEDDAINDTDAPVSLFIKNLSFSTTEEALKTIFVDCTGFRSVRIMTKKKPVSNAEMKESIADATAKLSLGYGFVEFDRLENAKSALRRFFNVMLDDHLLDIKLAKSSVSSLKKNKATGTPLPARSGSITKRNISKKLIVKNVPFEASRSELYALFSAYGNIHALRIPKKTDGTSRGYAFVEFLTKTEASNAFEHLQNTHLYGRHLVLEATSDETATNVEQALQRAMGDKKRNLSIAEKERKRNKIEM
ncbi:Rna recognition motif-containing protein [Cardiosporidium cionae]|uniref:Rna recognition motif-containing protein n=1 Tax=Cardiosporidium cionae TaxID=476202 RepID=A0ABQ7JFE4_9APIC|nr:Rna recognition motif-containing protein [Cardiosporidium cionae]|eukprot:KAF8822600.1 Rna recognition motif-containing protein [Cardiosporidium cionae]